MNIGRMTLAALAALSLAGTLAHAEVSGPGDGGLVVARGVQVDVVTPQAGSEVLVLRGEPIVRRPPATAAGGTARAGMPAVAGQRIWFIDQPGDRLIACHLRDSLRVDRRVIRCSERPLPQ